MTEQPTQCPAPETPAKPRKPGRGLRIALVVSLMVNLLVLGVMAGGVMRAARIAPEMMTGGVDIRSMWRAMPDSARSQLRTIARDRGFHGDDLPRLSREDRRERDRMRNTRIIEALRAEPFDPAAFAQLMRGERDAFTRRLDEAGMAFAEQLGALTPQERAEMANELTRSWMRREH